MQAYGFSSSTSGVSDPQCSSKRVEWTEKPLASKDECFLFNPLPPTNDLKLLTRKDKRKYLIYIK